MSEKSKIRQAVRKLRIVYGEGDAYVAEMVARSPEHAIACKSGCAHCCRLLPLVTMAEALGIAQRLLEDPHTQWGPLAARIDKQVEILMSDSPTGAEWFKRQIPCALLKDETCSVYQDRPAACRMLYAVGDPDNCAASPDGEAKKVSRPDFRAIEGQVGRNAMVLSNSVGVTWAAAPVPIALQWAILVLNQGSEALRQKLRGTPFANEEAAIAFWSNMLKTPEEDTATPPA